MNSKNSIRMHTIKLADALDELDGFIKAARHNTKDILAKIDVNEPDFGGLPLPICAGEIGRLGNKVAWHVARLDLVIDQASCEEIHGK